MGEVLFDDELPLSKGDEYVLLKRSEEGEGDDENFEDYWMLETVDGTAKGLAPSNHLEVLEPSCSGETNSGSTPDPPPLKSTVPDSNVGITDPDSVFLIHPDLDGPDDGIETNMKTLRLRADSKEEMESWLSAISVVVGTSR